MASKKPIALYGGVLKQLQAGDTLDAATTEVDVVSKTNDNASAIVIGTPVYVKSDGDVDKARANAQSTSEVLGLVRDTSISAAATGIIQTDGVLTATTTQWDSVTGQSGGLTPGSVYYLSSATAGLLTTTPPSTVGEYVVRVGVALNTTDMDISKDAPIGL